MRIEDLAKTCACATECNQCFCDEDEDFKVTVGFSLVRDRAKQWRRLDVRALFQPGIDGENDGMFEMTAVYDLGSQSISDLYAHGENINQQQVPELLNVYLKELKGIDSRYAPFINPLVKGCVIDKSIPHSQYSNPN